MPTITFEVDDATQAKLENFRVRHNAKDANDTDLADVNAYVKYRFDEIFTAEVAHDERIRFDAVWLDPTKRAAALTAGESA